MNQNGLRITNAHIRQHWSIASERWDREAEGWSELSGMWDGSGGENQPAFFRDLTVLGGRVYRHILRIRSSVPIPNPQYAVWDRTHQAWIIPPSPYRTHAGVSSKDANRNVMFTAPDGCTEVRLFLIFNPLPFVRQAISPTTITLKALEPGTAVNSTRVVTIAGTTYTFPTILFSGGPE